MSVEDDKKKGFPQSVRHKQILDVAEENPEASIDGIASQVASATLELVERVFDKYGDAGDDEESPNSVGSTATETLSQNDYV